MFQCSRDNSTKSHRSLPPPWGRDRALPYLIGSQIAKIFHKQHNMAHGSHLIIGGCALIGHKLSLIFEKQGLYVPSISIIPNPVTILTTIPDCLTHCPSYSWLSNIMYHPKGEQFPVQWERHVSLQDKIFDAEYMASIFLTDKDKEFVLRLRYNVQWNCCCAIATVQLLQ